MFVGSEVHIENTRPGFVLVAKVTHWYFSFQLVSVNHRIATTGDSGQGTRRLAILETVTTCRSPVPDGPAPSETHPRGCLWQAVPRVESSVGTYGHPPASDSTLDAVVRHAKTFNESIRSPCVSARKPPFFSYPCGLACTLGSLPTRDRLDRDRSDEISYRAIKYFWCVPHSPSV